MTGDRSDVPRGAFRAGGMGEVYPGADSCPSPTPAHPRLAAVKTVRAELAGDPAFRDRFRREMRTARSIESRFTARATVLGSGGSFYLTFENGTVLSAPVP